MAVEQIRMPLNSLVSTSLTAGLQSPRRDTFRLPVIAEGMALCLTILANASTYTQVSLSPSAHTQSSAPVLICCAFCFFQQGASESSAELNSTKGTGVSKQKIIVIKRAGSTDMLQYGRTCRTFSEEEEARPQRLHSI